MLHDPCFKLLVRKMLTVVFAPCGDVDLIRVFQHFNVASLSSTVSLSPSAPAINKTCFAGRGVCHRA